jgi:small redox-active disulfide protein 2
MVNIKVLGSGCPNCKRLEQIARQAVDTLGVEAEFEKVTEYQKILDYNIMSTPGLVINEEVVSYGRIPSEIEIQGWVEAAIKAQ